MPQTSVAREEIPGRNFQRLRNRLQFQERKVSDSAFDA
jgi:hypothetical protein